MKSVKSRPGKPGRPLRTYFLTYLGLLALLGATFGAAHVDLGTFNFPAGILIAVAKGVLVAVYFMHLRRASGVTRVAAGVGFFWLGILFLLSLTDFLSRGQLLLPGHWP